MRRACAALAAALLATPVVSHAGDLRGARSESLRGDLQSLRARALRAPRASLHDLKQLQRRLAEQRVETPDDPRLGRLELQRRQALWQAERALRLGRAAAGRARLEAVRDQLEPPAYLRAPIDLDLRGGALPIGTAKLFLFIQRGLRDASADLGRGRTGAAAAWLAGAERGFRALQTEAHADDANLIALAAEIASLRTRLEAADGAG